MKNLPTFALAGLGIYVVSSLLRATAKASPSFAPRGMDGYATLMDAYDPVGEAIGCSGAGDGSFSELGDADGLGRSFRKKLKKKLKKVVSIAVKKPMQLVKRDFKKAGRIVKRDFKKATKPLVRDFRKAGSLMKNDFSRAGAMFGGKKKGPPSAQGTSIGGTRYLDENGNEITEAQYNAAMAQYEAEANQTPGIVPDGHGSPDDGNMYSMDSVAADLFEQNQDTPAGPGFQDLSVLAASQDYADATGFTDGVVPYTGADLWQFPNPDAGDSDPLVLPEQLQQDTLDVYAGSMTDGNNMIMPKNEPATPFSADELYVGFDDPESDMRGDTYTPSAVGADYGNPQADYGTYDAFDWDWNQEGLGDVVMRPRVLGNAGPAVLSMVRSQRRPDQHGRIRRTKKPTPFKADRQGTVYAQNGGSLHRVGTLQSFAQALGLGCADLGRDMLGGWSNFRKRAEKVSKNVATYTTPSGFAYSRLKKNKKLYREYRVVAKQSMPYVAIAAGATLSVLSVGALSPAGAVMIAGGVASLGTQAYSDISAAKTNKEIERQIEADRLHEALQSTNVINDTQNLHPSGGPAAGEIPGGDWPWQYPGDGIVADFLDLSDAFV